MNAQVPTGSLIPAVDFYSLLAQFMRLTLVVGLAQAMDPPDAQQTVYDDQSEIAVGDLTNPKTRFKVIDKPAASGLPPEVRRWQEKALRGYAEAQDRKWRRWYETMFGPKP